VLVESAIRTESDVTAPKHALEALRIAGVQYNETARTQEASMDMVMRLLQYMSRPTKLRQSDQNRMLLRSSILTAISAAPQYLRED